MPTRLDARVAEAYEALRRDLGDLGVSQADFGAALERAVAPRVQAGLGPDEVLEGLVLEDMYLVVGCLAGDPRALRAFSRQHGTFLRAVVQRDAPSGAADEIVQELWATLFLPRRPGEPGGARLASYRGQGSLRGWLRVTARRLVIDRVRRERPGARATLTDLAAPEDGTESTLAAVQAARRLQPAFAEAFAALGDEDRALLKARFVDGLVLREIAARIGLNTSTVFRRLEAAQEAVWRGFRRRAQAEHGLDEGALRSLCGALAQTIDVEVLFAIVLLIGCEPILRGAT